MVPFADLCALEEAIIVEQPCRAPMEEEAATPPRRPAREATALAEPCPPLQANTDTAVYNLQQLNDQLIAEIAALRVGRADKAMMLVDSKSMCPPTFKGTQSALYRPWAKKIKAYTN